jgi:serine/threonine-protein kinase
MDAAAQAFSRTIDIYRQVYGGPHFRVGVALANLGSVHLAAGRLAEAEPLFRQAIDMSSATQSPDHLNTAIARIKLGRTLVRQKRFADAEPQIIAGYESMSRQTNPSVSWLRAAREDLAIVYDALGRPDQAAKFRAELAKTAQASSGQRR